MGRLRTNQDLDRLALIGWETIKGEVGLARTGWAVQTLSRRDDPQISNVTLLAKHDTEQSLTFKFQLRPTAIEGFRKHHNLQKTAYERFPHSKFFTMPQPVHLSETQQASLMTYIDGEPVSEAMKQCATHSDQLALLAKAGAWLDAFHRSQGFETRNFQPSYTLNYYLSLEEQLQSGRLQVAAKPLFLRGIEKLKQLAPEVSGLNTIAAMQHGDFHLRNLIVNGEQIAGIDVSKDHFAPIGHDVAKVLLDFTTVFRNARGLDEGQLVHADTLDAFFDGYQLTTRCDPSVRFLLNARVLATMFTVPSARDDRTSAKQRTLKRIRPFARNGFPEVGVQEQARPKKEIHFLLTQRSVEVAKRGEHEFANLVESALGPMGFSLKFSQDTPNARNMIEDDDLSFVHMSEPAGLNGLVFRRAYAGSFWHIEKRSARWKWRIATKSFDPSDIDLSLANAFFGECRAKLIPKPKPKANDESYVYMPLQGKLLQQRSFQSASPIEMISKTLENCTLDVRATLHPSEAYSDAELTALEQIHARNNRFSVVNLDMHEALSSCEFVVTENSSAAFHAVLYEKPSILFADIDFHHICAKFDQRRPSSAFVAVQGNKFPFRQYLYWYWVKNCIDANDKDLHEKLFTKLAKRGWIL